MHVSILCIMHVFSEDTIPAPNIAGDFAAFHFYQVFSLCMSDTARSIVCHTVNGILTTTL